MILDVERPITSDLPCCIYKSIRLGIEGGRIIRWSVKYIDFVNKLFIRVNDFLSIDNKRLVMKEGVTKAERQQIKRGASVLR